MIFKNFYVKYNGKIYKNPIRPLIENLDKLPWPDRSIYYDKYPVLLDNPTKTFMVGRGCPYRCSYCFNHKMMSLYKNKGAWVRLRSVDNIIGEMKDIKDKYGFKWIQINDDTFNTKREWIDDFLVKYRKTIAVPFICNLRAEKVDETLINELKISGCDRINMGG